MTKIGKVPEIIKELYASRNELRKISDRWRFTLDGKLVGDIGEALACYHFDLEPLSEGTVAHDAKTKDGKKKIQIKTTQGDRVGLGLTRQDFDYLIVVKLNEDGSYEFIYNGPGALVLKNAGSQSISVKKLEKLQSDVAEKSMIIRKK